MKPRLVNLTQTDANIAEQYPDIFYGLQKDAIQNSWDARQTKQGKDWKVIFRFIHDRNILVIEDFGTTGMDEKKWSKYQNLWDTEKTDDDSLGARGQGKFLFHYFSKTKTVLTETIDQEGTYRFSWGTNEGYDDETKKLQDFVPGAAKLDHQGSKLWIMDINPEFREDLLDVKQFIRNINSTWWEIIQNYGAVIIVNLDGVERAVVVPDFPKPLKEKEYKNEKIKDLGKIRNLVLSFFKDDISEEFRGIAIQRGGMTVLRLPVNADATIKRKVSGYCNFDEHLDHELKSVETPNHLNFQNRIQWNHVRDFVRRKTDEFVLEISPKREKVEVSTSILEEAVKLVNDLVTEYAPELLSGPPAPEGKGGEKEPPVHPRDKSPVRIDILRPNQHKFEFNESLKIECEIVNEMPKGKDLIFKLIVENPSGEEKHNSRYTFHIAGHSRKIIDIQLIDFDEESEARGKYTGKGTLFDNVSKDHIHEKSFTFYLDMEPPRKGKSFVSKFEFILGKRSDGGIQQFAKWKTLPLTDNGILRIVFDHPEFIRLRDLPKTKKEQNREILLYITRCSIDEVMTKLIEISYRDNILDFEKIREVKNHCEEMLYEASVRTI